MTTNIIIGNAIFFVGCLINVLNGLVKDKKKLIGFQIIQFLIMGIGNLFLGAISGVIADIVSIVRNVYCLKKDYSGVSKYFFVGLQALLTIAFNTEGIIGILPLAAVCIYSFFIGENDPKRFRIFFIISQVFWTIYDIIHLNIVAAIFDVLTIITNLISLKRIVKDENE